MSTAAIQTVQLGEVRGEDQAHQIQRSADLNMTSTDAKHSNLSSEAATSTESAISVVDSGNSTTSLNWDKSLSTLLSAVIGYFGQQFMNYIAGVSEKMEKLEYY